MKYREYYVTVVLTVEDDVRLDDVKEYVQDAVNCWGGQFHPTEPFFGDNKAVRLGKSGRGDKPRVKKPLTRV